MYYADALYELSHLILTKCLQVDTNVTPIFEMRRQSLMIKAVHDHLVVQVDSDLSQLNLALYSTCMS